MTTYELFNQTATKWGCDETLTLRLFNINELSCVAWTCEQLIGDNPYDETLTFAALVGLPEHTVRYLCYDRKKEPVAELQKRIEYFVVVDTLHTEFATYGFWQSFLPFAYKTARRLAAEVLVQRGWTPTKIAEQLNIGESSAYTIRRNALKNQLKEYETF